MTLTITKKQMWKAFLRHFIIWIIWYGITSLSLIGTLDKAPIFPLLYNYISLVILFYPVYYCARGYWHTVAYLHAQSLNKWDRFIYLFFRWPVVLILFFVLTYIIGSWYIDRHLFKIMYDNFPLYCNGRWTRASTYVFVAIGYSYLKYIQAKYAMKLEAANIKIVILKDVIATRHVENQAAIQELIKRVDEYTGRKAS